MDFLRRASNATWVDVGNIALLAGWAIASGLFSWAVAASGIFGAYAPFSWMFAAFVGAGLAALIYQLGISAHRQLIRNRYDAKLLANGGAIDPLAKTFESKRIYLNEFALPSKPLIEGKTFIECELIGPANVVLVSGNTVTDQQLPICDAILIAEGADPSNGYVFRNCIFRNCSFVRVTFMVTSAELDAAKRMDWLRWISVSPEGGSELFLDRQFQMGALPSPSEEERAEASHLSWWV
jgi:hypothetical protein